MGLFPKILKRLFGGRLFSFTYLDILNVRQSMLYLSETIGFPLRLHLPIKHNYFKT